jgi:hypothetical protein
MNYSPISKAPRFPAAFWLVLLGAAILGGASVVLGVHEDHLINCGAALRLLDGQRPYRDFLMPHGPLAWLLLAPFLLLPVTLGTALVLASATLNAGAALVTWRLVYHVTRSRRHALYGAALTAIWFLPVFGSYYHDHLAYFFVLCAIACYTSDVRAPWRAVATAVCLVLAFHTKQTVGVLALGALALMDVLLRSSPWSLLGNRQLVPFVGAFAACHALVVAVLLAAGGAMAGENYLLYGVLLPMEYARDPASDKPPIYLLAGLVWPWKVHVPRLLADSRSGYGDWAFCVLIAAAYAGYYALAESFWSSRASPRTGRWLAAGFFLAYLAISLGAGPATKAGLAVLTLAAGLTWWLCRRGPSVAVPPPTATLALLLLTTMWCSALLGRSYLELAFGAGGAVALTLYVLFGTERRPAVQAAAVAAVAVAGCLVIGWNRAGLRNYDPDLFSHVRLDDMGELAPIRSLWVADCTPGRRDRRIDGPTIQAVLDFTAPAQGRVAAIDDKASFLLLMLRRVDALPNVYYHEGLTVPIQPEQRRRWEADLVRSLEDGQVEWVVYALGAGLRDFRVDQGTEIEGTLATLVGYLERTFTLAYVRGPYRIYCRRPPGRGIGADEASHHGRVRVPG